MYSTFRKTSSLYNKLLRNRKPIYLLQKFNHSTPPSSQSNAQLDHSSSSSRPELNLKEFIEFDRQIRQNESINKYNGYTKEYNTNLVEFAGLNVKPKNYELYSKSRIPEILESKLSLNYKLENNNYGTKEHYNELVAAGTILPMRTNNYVCDELIDWNNIPNDPIFQLTFPQPGMLDPKIINEMVELLSNPNIDNVTIRNKAEEIRNTMNPHPAGQKQMNVPTIKKEFIDDIQDDSDSYIKEMPGVQHKYRETVLFFPTEAQYCHAFCTYCFRWAQFTAVGSEQAFASKDSNLLQKYLSLHKSVTDLLFTGGDPMVMTAKQFSKYIDPILTSKEMDHINTIRIGTKSLAYWPYRFLSEPDSDDILRMFERIIASGRQISIMAHFSHSVELSTPAVQEAIRRIRMTGANIRTQAPLIAHVNDDPLIWAEKWRIETRLGCVPYYMFVERDTGARHYFQVPLYKGVEIFREAYQMQSGLGKTVRGPSMSCVPGKVHILGVIDIPNNLTGKTEKAFLLQFLQGRKPQWVNKPFLAKYDENAVWFDDLQPFSFGNDNNNNNKNKFFFEDEMELIAKGNIKKSSGQQFEHKIPLNDLILPSGLTNKMVNEIKTLEKERQVFVPRK